MQDELDGLLHAVAHDEVEPPPVLGELLGMPHSYGFCNQTCLAIIKSVGAESQQMKKLQEEQAKRDAEWKPVRDLRC